VKEKVTPVENVTYLLATPSHLKSPFHLTFSILLKEGFFLQAELPS
jgi:hypothetical protein